MNKIRKRDEEYQSVRDRNKLTFKESTYHFSSKEKEEAFVKAQFNTPELLEAYRSYRREWHRRAAEMDAGEYPLAISCELVSFCNLKCEMCYTRTKEFQRDVVGSQRMIPWEIVKDIIDECAEIGVKSILFSWRGESTLYKAKGLDGVYHDFADVLEYARMKGILERTCLTNGRALVKTLIRKIVLAQPNWVSFSIDGLSSTYNKIRGAVEREATKDPFSLVADNIREMVAFRDANGFSVPQIRTNTIFPAIAHDPEGYRRSIEELGVGLVTINEMLDYRGQEIPEKDILDDWFCQYPFQRLVVSASGTILPCPGIHGETRELVIGRYRGTAPKKMHLNGETQVLEYPEVTLLEAWNSQRIKEIRNLHRENRRKELKTCKYCRHGAITHGVEWIPDDWDMEKMQWGDRSWRNN